jgi:hypothetical protein
LKRDFILSKLSGNPVIIVKLRDSDSNLYLDTPVYEYKATI